MKIGDLAYDIATKQYVVIVGEDIAWKDSDDQTHYWDFEVMAEGVGLYYVDVQELEIHSEKQEEKTADA